MLPPSFSGILIPEGLTVYIELPFLEQLKRGKKDYSDWPNWMALSPSDAYPAFALRDGFQLLRIA
jgi:hypothetical protein